MWASRASCQQPCGVPLAARHAQQSSRHCLLGSTFERRKTKGGNAVCKAAAATSSMQGRGEARPPRFFFPCPFRIFRQWGGGITCPSKLATRKKGAGRQWLPARQRGQQAPALASRRERLCTKTTAQGRCCRMQSRSQQHQQCCPPTRARDHPVCPLPLSSGTKNKEQCFRSNSMQLSKYQNNTCTNCSPHRAKAQHPRGRSAHDARPTLCLERYWHELLVLSKA